MIQQCLVSTQAGDSLDISHVGITFESRMQEEYNQGDMYQDSRDPKTGQSVSVQYPWRPLRYYCIQL